MPTYQSITKTVTAEQFTEGSPPTNSITDPDLVPVAISELVSEESPAIIADGQWRILLLSEWVVYEQSGAVVMSDSEFTSLYESP